MKLNDIMSVYNQSVDTACRHCEVILTDGRRGTLHVGYSGQMYLEAVDADDCKVVSKIYPPHIKEVSICRNW